MKSTYFTHTQTHTHTLTHTDTHETPHTSARTIYSSLLGMAASDTNTQTRAHTQTKTYITALALHETNHLHTHNNLLILSV